METNKRARRMRDLGAFDIRRMPAVTEIEVAKLELAGATTADEI